MSATGKMHGMSRALEGGVFYPTGYIVAGIAAAAAAALRADFLRAGYEEHDCILVSPREMLVDASDDVQHSNIVALLGSGLQARQQHLNLAREGCSFLLVYAPTDPEKNRVMRVLARVPVRYAVHYHRFTIEDLIERLPSATADAKTARSTDTPGKSPH